MGNGFNMKYVARTMYLTFFLAYFLLTLSVLRLLAYLPTYLRKFASLLTQSLTCHPYSAAPLKSDWTKTDTFAGEHWCRGDGPIKWFLGKSRPKPKGKKNSRHCGPNRNVARQCSSVKHRNFLVDCLLQTKSKNSSFFVINNPQKNKKIFSNAVLFFCQPLLASKLASVPSPQSSPAENRDTFFY